MPRARPSSTRAISEARAGRLPPVWPWTAPATPTSPAIPTPTATDRVYCGYIAGSANASAQAVAVDSAGNAYATGDTASAQTSFPVTVGPDLTFNGPLNGNDAFVAKVNATSPYGLVYCGYIGGS